MNAPLAGAAEKQFLVNRPLKLKIGKTIKKEGKMTLLPRLRKYVLGILILIPCLLWTHYSLAIALGQEEKGGQKEIPEILGLEVLGVIKSTGNQNISLKVEFSTSEGEVKVMGIAKPMQPDPGFMFVLINLNLINSTDKIITFKLGNLKASSEAEDKMTLLYLATFDDAKESYTQLNIKPPEVGPRGQAGVKVLAIAKKTCPLLTLKYSGGEPIQVDLSSLPLSASGNERGVEIEHQQPKTILIGEPSEITFKGEDFTVLITQIIPGREKTVLAHNYFDQLPPLIQKYAAELGYKPGDIVKFALGKNAGDHKILPPDHLPASSSAADWKLTKLATKGDPAPGAGGTFLEFGEAWANKAGELLFWARFGTDKHDWALYVNKDGKTSHVMTEGVKFPLPDGREENFTHETQFFFSGEDLFYFQVGFERLYALNGSGVKGVLPYDDEIELAGKTKIIISAGLLNIYGKETIFIKYKAKGKKSDGILAYSQGKYFPLMDQNSLLPGLDNVYFNAIAGAVPALRMPLFIPFSEKNFLAVMEVNSPAYKKALIHYTPEKASKIVAVGEDHPLDAKKTVDNILWLDAQSPERFVIFLSWKNKKGFKSKTGVDVILYDRGNIQLLKAMDDLYIESLRDISPYKREVARGGTFLNSDSPAYAFMTIVFLYNQSLSSISGRQATHLFYFDGQKTEDILSTIDQIKAGRTIQFSSRLQAVGGEFNGCLLLPVSMRFILIFDPKDDLIQRFAGEVLMQSFRNPASVQTPLFFDVNSPEKGLQDPPDFKVEGGRKVTIADILEWTSAEQAYVRLEDGIYLLGKNSDQLKE
jgi:hypothetical protein